MRIVDMHGARNHLSLLVEAAAKGEPFIIARAGKPLAKVVALDAPEVGQQIGSLAGQVSVADDFDSMGADQIRTVFRGGA